MHGVIKMESQEFLDRRQVAQRAGITVQTLWRYMRSGQGPAALRLPTGHYRFEVSEVDRWINSLRQVRIA